MRILVIFAAISACFAQAEFEIASVKANTSMSRDSNFNRTPGGGLDAINVTVRSYITIAYDIRDHQLIGGPEWVNYDRYDITARATHDPGATAAGAALGNMDDVRQRLRALLADRFKLVVHQDMKEMPGYALVVAKNGPHLEPSTTQYGPQVKGQRGILTCKKMPMKHFAEDALSPRLGRNVADETGLTGEYDFVIKYAEEQDIVAGTSNLPDFLTAMQEQLGLKLEPRKVNVQVMVIDHIEKASAN